MHARLVLLFTRPFLPRHQPMQVADPARTPFELSTNAVRVWTMLVLWRVHVQSSRIEDKIRGRLSRC